MAYSLRAAMALVLATVVTLTPGNTNLDNYGISLVEAAVKNKGKGCWAGCENDVSFKNGACDTGFCGDGVCCKKGIHVYIYIYICVCVCVCMYVCMLVHVHVYKREYICVRVTLLCDSKRVVS